MTNNFEFYTRLREYHVYSNTISCQSYVGHKIMFKREHNNPYEKFVVARKVTMSRRWTRDSF